MQITVVRVPRPNVSQTLSVPEGSTIGHIVKLAGALPDQVVVLRGQVPIPIDAPALSGDELRIVNVFSGG